MKRRHPNMPVVTVYPRCGVCGVPFALRHGFDVMNGGGEVWLWTRDCKHKKAAPTIDEVRK